MTSDYDVTKQNKVRQLKDKAAYDRDTVHAILDAGVVVGASAWRVRARNPG